MENWDGYEITDYARLQCIGGDAGELIKALLTNIEVGIGLFEVGEQIRALYLNANFFQIIGYSQESYAKHEKDVLETFVAEDVEGLMQCIRSHSLDGTPVSYRFRGYREDGSVGWFALRASRVESRIDGLQVYLAVVMDVTESVEREEQLQQMNAEYAIQQERYRILEATAQGILFEYFHDEDRMVLSYNLPNNKKQKTIENYTKLLNQFPMVHSDHVEEFKELLFLSCKEDREGDMEYLSTVSGGGYRWHVAHYKSLVDDNGKIVSVMGRIEDIDDQKMNQERMNHRAERDGLTNIYRKKVAFEKMNEYVKEARTSVFYFGILDLDHFKEINDQYGHQYGDTIIKQVADMMTALFAEDCIIGRFGGDEFIFLTKNLSKEAVQERLGQMKVDIEFSAGIVQWEPGQTIEAVFERADHAMYQAKDTGRNHIVFL